MANSVDPDLKKPTDLDIHCLQNRLYPGSAGQGLIYLPDREFFKECHKVVYFGNAH